MLMFLLMLLMMDAAAAADGETEFTFRHRRSTEQGQKGGKVKQKLLQ
jgi:hypothetical protein